MSIKCTFRARSLPVPDTSFLPPPSPSWTFHFPSANFYYFAFFEFLAFFVPFLPSFLGIHQSANFVQNPHSLGSQAPANPNRSLPPPMSPSPVSSCPSAVPLPSFPTICSFFHFKMIFLLSFFIPKFLLPHSPHLSIQNVFGFVSFLFSLTILILFNFHIKFLFF